MLFILMLLSLPNMEYVSSLPRPWSNKNRPNFPKVFFFFYIANDRSPSGIAGINGIKSLDARLGQYDDFTGDQQFLGATEVSNFNTALPVLKFKDSSVCGRECIHEKCQCIHYLVRHTDFPCG